MTATSGAVAQSVATTAKYSRPQAYSTSAAVVGHSTSRYRHVGVSSDKP